MKVIIAGSRSITNYTIVEEILDTYRDVDITEVVSGGAPGVDTLGEYWAEDHGVPFVRFPADWATHGKAAGYIRNKEMGDYANALLAIWDGKSRGTKHMIDYMKSLEKPVSVVVLQPEHIPLEKPLPKGIHKVLHE